MAGKLDWALIPGWDMKASIPASERDRLFARSSLFVTTANYVVSLAGLINQAMLLNRNRLLMISTVADISGIRTVWRDRRRFCYY